jgi:hypothetical protein
LAVRHRSILGTVRAAASEVPRSVELEQRVSGLELVLKDLLEKIEVLKKRAVALEAHLDHLDARVGRR